MTPKQDEFNKKEMALFNELWNEHDGDHFYKDEWRDYLLSFADRVREEERKDYEAKVAVLTPEDKKDLEDTYEKGRKDMLEEVLEEHQKEIEKYRKTVEKYNIRIKSHLRYCREQNGMDYCKNCGLGEQDIIK